MFLAATASEAFFPFFIGQFLRKATPPQSCPKGGRSFNATRIESRMGLALVSFKARITLSLGLSPISSILASHASITPVTGKGRNSEFAPEG
jgi:hypothetical protein